VSTVRDAATVVVVRDAPDLEVFMLRRSLEMVFSPGAFVFPGGAVDPADRSAEARARVRGLDERAASARLGRGEGGLAWWIAAVREAFEEGDLLLARDAVTGAPARPAAHAALRRALNDGTADACDLLVGADLEIDAEALPVFAHWLTPVGAPRRYDTWFFVAAAPPGQPGRHDDDEAVHSEWVRPRDVLRRHRDGEVDLIQPTRRTLEAIGRFSTAAELLAVLRDAHERSGARGPEVVPDHSGERLRLPGDPRPGSGRRTWTIPLPERRLVSTPQPGVGTTAAVDRDQGVA
jgi:8-oxo-dGTP pyrophosphatase MutT (NUDIX family)